MLKEAIESAIDETVNVIHGREGMSEGRPQIEIAIHAIHGGDIVGDHTVLFANNQETIEIKHLANSKELLFVVHCNA